MHYYLYQHIFPRISKTSKFYFGSVISSFNCFYKIMFISFKRNLKINMDILNGVTYKHAHFQCKIICITSYTKMKKYDKFADLNMYIIKSTHLSFCVSKNTKHLKIYILHFCGISHCYIQNFCLF
jgi:hypothetical protein